MNHLIDLIKQSTHSENKHELYKHFYHGIRILKQQGKWCHRQIVSSSWVLMYVWWKCTERNWYNTFFIKFCLLAAYYDRQYKTISLWKSSKHSIVAFTILSWTIHKATILYSRLIKQISTNIYQKLMESIGFASLRFVHFQL